jgi:hypothetical protein
MQSEPKHVDARYYLALSCRRIGQKAKALEHYKRLREADRKKAEQLKAEMDKGR